MILNRISFGQIQSFAAIAHISPKSMNLLFIFILFFIFWKYTEPISRVTIHFIIELFQIHVY